PIAISGDKALMLAGRVVTSVALILHELATNSVKYGGLGHAEGALRIAVEHAGDDRGSARLLWVEERPGLEEVRTASGFGTRLVERSVAHIGGTLSRRVATGRLEIELVLPIVIDRI
ncbi:MAG TPA: PAS domain S-box protein, partial [Allosphingosinicella sp.]